MIWIQIIPISKVLKVIDGDSFKADIGILPPICGRKIPIRVKRVNCKELRKGRTDEAAAAEAARLFLNEKIARAKQIILLNVERDKYFRLLSDVQIDGQDLASELVRAGHGVWFNKKMSNRKVKENGTN